MSSWWTPSYIPFDEADKIVEDYEKGICIYCSVADWENSLRGKKDDLDYKNPVQRLLKEIDEKRACQHEAEELIRDSSKLEWYSFRYLTRDEIVRIVVTNREKMGLRPYPAKDDTEGMLCYNAILDKWVVMHPHQAYGIKVLIDCEQAREKKAWAALPWKVRAKKFLGDVELRLLEFIFVVIALPIEVISRVLKLDRSQKVILFKDDFGGYHKWCEAEKHKFHKYL